MAQNPEELIFTEVKNKNIKMVEKLLEEGVDINILEPNKERTPLYYAVAYNFIEIAQLLIDRGAKYYIKNKKKANVFHLACYSGATEILRILIEKKIESDSDEIQTLMDQNTYQGVTPFYMASEQGNIDIIEILYDLHKDRSNPIEININAKRTIVGYSPLLIASSKEDIEIVKRLIKWGADIEAIDHLNRSPLYIATISGNIDIVNLLLKGGAETNTTPCTDTGLTPILEAAKLGHRDIFLLLLDNARKPANPNVKSNLSGFTPLMIAIESNQIDIVNILCERCVDLGVDLNIQTNSGFTALILAILFANENKREPKRKLIPLLLLKYLTELKLDLNLKDKDDNTALMFAIYYYDFEIAEKLLDLGADPMIKNVHNHIALNFALNRQNENIINKILNKFRITVQWFDGDEFEVLLSKCNPSLKKVHIGGPITRENIIILKKKLSTIINKEFEKELRRLKLPPKPNKYNIISKKEDNKGVNPNINSDIFKHLTLNTLLVHHTFIITVKPTPSNRRTPERTSPGGGGGAAEERPQRTPTPGTNSNSNLILNAFSPEGGGGTAQPKRNAQIEELRMEIKEEFQKHRNNLKEYNTISPRTLRIAKENVEAGKVNKSKKKTKGKNAKSKNAKSKNAKSKNTKGKNAKGKKAKGKKAKSKKKTKD